MSLRLLQKKLGQDSEERQRQLGHGPVQGRRGGWLGSKPRAPLGRPAPAKESEAQQSGEQGFYTPKGKGGSKGKGREGKGRGSSSFLASFGEQSAGNEEPSTDWSAPPAQSSSFAPSSSSAAPVSSQEDAIPEEAVEGLTEVLLAAQLQHYASAASAWCDEQGAANLTELLEALDDFAQELHLKTLERKRLEKVLIARVGGNGDSSAADAVKSALAAAVASGDLEDLRKALADARQAGVTEVEEAEEALRCAEAEAELQAAVAEGTDAARLEAALEAAKEAGASQKLISEAAAALESLRSAPEVEGLEAVLEEARLPQHLDRAASWALERGLSRCHEVNEHLEELAVHLKLKPLERKRLGKAFDAYTPADSVAEKDPQRDAAQEALARAAAGTAVEPLVRAIAKAEELGLSVQSAKDKLRTLQAEAQKKQAMLDLTTALQEDSHAIEVALSYAEEVGVEEAALREARAELKRRADRVQKRKDAESALSAALEQPDLQVLEAAISQAEDAAVDEEDLQGARIKLEAGKGAQDALVAVMDLDDADALAAAIKSVEEVGLYSTRTLEDARAKLLKLQDALREREEAEAVLADAAGESDIEALEAAISSAEDAGVGIELLKDAEERLQELREKAQEVQSAEDALEHAESTNDVAAMSDAIKCAQAAGVSKELVARAQGKLQRWQEGLQKVQDARAALEIAIEADDAEKLAAAMDCARQVGVEPGLVEAAEQTLQLLQKRKGAVAAVAEALQSGDLHSLTSAIEAAEDDGVGEEGLQEARAKVKESMSALDTMISSMSADDVDELAAAIEGVEAVGVYDDRPLQDAKERLRSLREALQAREEAEAALADAAGESDIEALEAAIATAVDAGVGSDFLKDAEERLGELRELAQETRSAEAGLAIAQAQGNVAVLRAAIHSARDARVNDEALAAAQAQLKALQEDLRSSLEAAVRGEDADALSAAIERSREMGVGTEVLQPAEDALQTLRKKREAVAALTEAVANASQDPGFQSLTSAIQTAEEAGVSEDELREAKAKVETGKKAHDDLLAAVEMDDTEALASAIKLVEEVGAYSADALDTARERLCKLHAREEAEGALADAAGDSDVEALEAAISSAADAEVDGDLLKDAEERLTQLKMRAQSKKDAENALRNAQTKGDLSALRRALKNAQEAQVCDEVLEEAQAQIRDLEEELHSVLEAAIAAEEADRLSATLKHARDMEVDGLRLERAEKALRALQRRREAVAALAKAKAVEDEGFQTLVSAIKAAEEAGVSEDDLREARSKLEAGRNAHDTLLAVLEMDDADALATAIGGVEEVGTCSREVLDEARARLQRLREEMRVREEAESALADAAGESDVGALETALFAAVDAGVDSDLLKDAEERLQELKATKEAEEILECALLQGDVAALRAAVKGAREANVREEVVKTAQATLDALEDEQRRLQDVRAALNSAVEAQDIDKLPVVIEQAREAGVELEILETAEQALQLLQLLQRRRESIEAVVAGLAQATPHGDLEPIRFAIKCAEDAGAGAEDLKDPKQRLQALEARAQQIKDAENELAKALLSDDIQTMAKAIGCAQECGVGEEQLARAEERLQELRDEAKKHKSEVALINIMQESDTEALAEAIEQARTVGVSTEVLKGAEERLQALKDEAQERDEAEASLAQAVDSGSIEDLQDSMRRAVAANVNEDTLKCARARLKTLQARLEQKTSSEHALAQAMDAGNIRGLSDAITLAVDAGVDTSLIEDAGQRLRTLKDRAQQRKETEESLARATAEGDAPALEAAVLRAKDLGLHCEALKQANKALKALKEQEEKRRRAEEKRRQAEKEEEERRRQAELEEEERRRQEAQLEEERRRQAELEEEERRRQAELEEEERRHQAELEEERRRQAELEEEERRRQVKLEEEERRRQAELEEEQRREAELEEERRRQAELEAAQEEERRLQAERELEEERRRQELEQQEERRRQAEAEQEEERRRQAEMEKEKDKEKDKEKEGKKRQAEDASKKKGKDKGGRSAAASSEAAAALQAAVASEDITAIGAAIAKAEKAGVGQQELAQAKRVQFQLQKDKREQAKREKSLRDAMDKLQAAESAEALQEAIGLAEKAGASATDLEDARSRLVLLEQQQQEEAIQLALKDVEYFISQGDVEAATVTLEDAAKCGASQDQLEAAEKALADLREKLDPEAEARRRRLEARKAKDTSRKWNFAGKSDNRIINDRFREHEAELERRRMLAFRARGRFKGDAEDEGEEGQEKNIRKQRAEVIKERGQVAPAKNEVRGFAYSKASKEESEAPRRLSLRAHLEMGAGIDLHASWWGMVVDSIDEEPGQPGLRLRDVLTEVNGTSLCELEAEDCEQRFADLFGDGCMVTVEPHVEAPGFLNASSSVDKESLQADLARFAEDWGVQIEVEDTGRGPGNLRIVLQGPQSAIKASKPELENLMKFYSES